MRTPFSLLDTPGKKRHMRQVLQRLRALLAQVQRTKARLEKVQQQSTLVIEEELSSNLLAIMAEAEEGVQKLPDNSFKKMFWEQQVHICIGSTYLTMHPNTICVYILYNYIYIYI